MTADLVTTTLWRSWFYSFIILQSFCLSSVLVVLHGQYWPMIAPCSRPLMRLFIPSGQFKPGQWPGAGRVTAWHQCYSYVTRHTGPAAAAALSPDLKQSPGAQATYHPHAVPAPPCSQNRQFASCPPKSSPQNNFIHFKETIINLVKLSSRYS